MAKVKQKPEHEPQPEAKKLSKAEQIEQDLLVKEEEQRLREERLDQLLGDTHNFKKFTEYEATYEQLMVLKKTVCKDLSNPEFYHYLTVCHALGLNAILKQVWCYKDSKGNVIIMVGRDGYLAHCEKQSGWRGISGAVICENDVFEPDYLNNTPVKHLVPKFKDRGKIIGAWAICRREGFEPRFVTVSYQEYTKDDKTYSNPWKTNPSSMIMKVAELEAMRKQFPLSGLQNEHDWNVNEHGIASPHDKHKKLNELMNESYDNARREVLSILEFSKHPEKEKIRQEIITSNKAKTLTIEMLEGYKILLLNGEVKHDEEE